MTLGQLQDLVARHLPSFLEVRSVRGKPVPWIVKRELYMFLTCNLLAFGYALLVSPGCGLKVKIPFSCKRRSICPRCINQRREERTHGLMTKVLPDVPFRHWVLSLPFELRYNLRHHPKLLHGVLRCFLDAIFAHHQLKVVLSHGLHPEMVFPGAISVKHRVSASLAANIHFHCLVIDGVYVERTRGGPLEFIAFRHPSAEELAQIATDTCRRARDLFIRHKVWTDSDEQPCIGAIRGNLSLRGPRPVHFYGRAVTEETTPTNQGDGSSFDVFARDRVGSGDRAGLENMVRYLLSPPFTEGQLELCPNDNVIVQFKRHRFDGTTQERRLPFELIQSLIAMVDSPRSHALGYHGVLARNARLRKLVVPNRRSNLHHDDELKTPEQRRAWKQLHQRAHRDQFLRCPVCYDKLVLVALVGKNLTYRDTRWLPPDTPLVPAVKPAPTETRAHTSKPATGASHQGQLFFRT